MEAAMTTNRQGRQPESVVLSMRAKANRQEAHQPALPSVSPPPTSNGRYSMASRARDDRSRPLRSESTPCRPNRLSLSQVSSN
ncbi:hypothetical protein B0T16DRAFT_396846 [Cercophora newfieldiana]|uniref:Uncharacterized protein n=1 Tax=Cercophora newfieldiana TaxID=92897 RepID=A0AA40D035_9PEZI|nr:hypothetical protein B0T16DRAFT_396846 [Cercophora newfieldiana]